MNETEEISFQIIANVGDTTACYMSAMEEAKQGNIEIARELIQEGERHYHKAHKVHSELIRKIAEGNNIDLNLLLVHAEDQLMNSEVIKMLAEQIIDLIVTIKNLKEE
ncbi:PTS lactose/cellobiose transporter subunit IIA [Oceanobacillus jeddahense]|uniref:PTS lactose/cellobiose transporter subunit IIA n=1 Tax=Oceanobacillus jeddahense TaxID=1462527 RepID=A0ABY5JLA6_9BACI|nr:PTS lactose/cellobiose transporter subunit IIA [Oceanobacillus jeddahense]UUI01079.1 PTS lactose/cellobiose transporter subunit IIA [Oceanobacillus jeddahense]